MITHTEIQGHLKSIITPQQANHYQIIPFDNEDDVIQFLISDEQLKNTSIKEELEIVLNRAVKLKGSTIDEITFLLNKYYRLDNIRGNNVSNVSESNQENFLLKLIEEANSLGSSDLHFEVYEDSCRIRIRIDGQLVERYSVQKEIYKSLINKIKIQANLDIAEKRLPQDGRIFFKNEETTFDIRVSVLPTLYGEKIVMRLLSKDASEIEISNLGFEKDELSVYLESIQKPNGIILISGPTGSGKTTTLYATLKILNKENRNVLTIEDPIEYTLKGINQVQLKEDIGLTFANTLRTFLRQDPDIIMVGEIRDADTANMAIRASLTGHLVLSTIHTNSAWGIIDRLMDMKIPEFLIASTLNICVAQRLVRLLCPYCKKKYSLSNSENINLENRFKNIILENWNENVGCERCYYTGFKGRKAVYEIIPIDLELCNAIKNNHAEVVDILKNKKIKTLADNAIELLNKGLTSFEEVYPLLQINYY